MAFVLHSLTPPVILEPTARRGSGIRSRVGIAANRGFRRPSGVRDSARWECLLGRRSPCRLDRQWLCPADVGRVSLAGSAGWAPVNGRKVSHSGDPGRLSDSSTGRTLRWWFPRSADGKVTTFIGTSPRPLSLASLDTESLHVYED